MRDLALVPRFRAVFALFALLTILGSLFPVKNKLHYSELVNNLVVSYSDIFHTGGTHVDVGHENCSHLVIEDSYVDGLPVEMLQAVNVVKQEVKQFQKRNEFKETRAVCVSL